MNSFWDSETDWPCSRGVALARVAQTGGVRARLHRDPGVDVERALDLGRGRFVAEQVRARDDDLARE